MKRRLFYLLPVLLLSTILLGACDDVDYFPCVRPSGSMIEESVISAPFDAVNLAMHASVSIYHGPEHTVTVIAPSNILEHVDIYSHGNTLNIYNSRCLRTKLNDVRIIITTPELNSLRMAGSGRITVPCEFIGDELTLEIAGSGNIAMQNVNYEHIRSFISGSGNIDLKGKTVSQQVQVSGSGKLNAFPLASEEAFVRISGSGSVRVHVTRFLDARISGSGNIYYTGSPGLSINISGSGKINHMDNDMIK